MSYSAMRKDSRDAGSHFDGSQEDELEYKQNLERGLCIISFQKF